MNEVDRWLLITRLREALRAVRAADGASALGTAWREADRAIDAAGAGEDATAALPVLERDADLLDALIAGWDARTTPLSEWDQAVLRRAMNAYKKRLKLVRADDEITSSRDPLSRGASSSITGVRPPEQYERDVWDLLVAHGRLRDGGHGVLELPSALPPL